MESVGSFFNIAPTFFPPRASFSLRLGTFLSDVVLRKNSLWLLLQGDASKLHFSTLSAKNCWRKPSESEVVLWKRRKNRRNVRLNKRRNVEAIYHGGTMEIVACQSLRIKIWWYCCLFATNVSFRRMLHRCPKANQRQIFGHLILNQRDNWSDLDWTF